MKPRTQYKETPTQYEYNETFGHMTTWTTRWRSRVTGTPRQIWDHVSCAMDLRGAWRVNDGGVVWPAETYFGRSS